MESRRAGEQEREEDKRRRGEEEGEGAVYYLQTITGQTWSNITVKIVAGS